MHHTWWRSEWQNVTNTPWDWLVLIHGLFGVHLQDSDDLLFGKLMFAWNLERIELQPASLAQVELRYVPPLL